MVLKQNFLFFVVAVCMIALSVSPRSSADPFRGSSSEILPVEEAVRFGYTESEIGIDLFWQVQPGYFLYRDKIAVIANGTRVEIPLPEGKWFLDATFGRVKVLEGFVTSSINALHEEVSIHYQACAEKGYCYPPQEMVLKSKKMLIKSKK